MKLLETKSAFIVLITACSMFDGDYAQQLASIRNFSYGSTVYSIAVDGDNVFAVGGVSFARQWKLSDPSYVLDYATGGWINSIAINGSILYVAQVQNGITSFPLGKNTFPKILPITSRTDAMVMYGDFLFTANDDGTVNQWQISPWGVLQIVTKRGCKADGDMMCPPWLMTASGDSLFVSGDFATIEHWNMSTLKSVRSYTIPNVNYISIIASSDEFLLAYDGPGNAVNIWRISTGESLPAILVNTGSWVTVLAAGGDYVFCALGDNTIHQYQISTQSLVRILNEHTDQAYSLTTYRPYLFSGSLGGLVKQWLIPELVVHTTVSSTSTTTATRSLKSESPTASVFNPVDSTNDPPVSIEFYIVVGSVALVSLLVLLMLGCAYHFIKVSRIKQALNQKRLESGSPMVLKSHGELSAISSTSRAAKVKYVNADMQSTGKSSVSASGADNRHIGVTSTLFTSKHQGLYVPGNYLLDTSNAIYQPLQLIYSNKNCSVQIAQVLDEELRQRCRTGLIAVKTIKRLSAELIEAFYQEISVMYFFVGKPNIVQLVGFCQAPYQALTDYYALGSLDKALLAGQSIVPSKRIALSFSLQISQALRLMHENGFSHSDIKALNVFVDKDNRGQLQCYLGDFGLAQVLDDSHVVVKAFNVFNSKGLTVPYAAPEILQHFRTKWSDNSLSSWTAVNFLKGDIYSLSVLLYEILNCDYAWQWANRKQ